ncbi:MAG: hypothetical protein EAZ89_14660 [Bacteroidetes bacterium]|nr:MAG: hypothetical protein EAZ89_14660 [Bacteroidota bacterium]
MSFRVGQRVRLLHANGEGVITRLIDKNNVEVDIGDDFPIDMNISEIIGVDHLETSYFARAEEQKTVAEKKVEAVRKLGVSVLEFSMIAVSTGVSKFDFYLVNPEPADMLFTCYARIRGKMSGMAYGQLGSGESRMLFSLAGDDLAETKAFYFQALGYVSGRGFPHEPFAREIAWSRAVTIGDPRMVGAINKEGWIFSLRTNPQAQDTAAIKDSEFVRIRRQDEPVLRPTLELDLHIEALRDDWRTMPVHEILAAQLERLARALSDSLQYNYASMIVIHGVGEGKLKKEVHDILKKTRHVKDFEPADAKRYGQGATKVNFR